MRVSYGKWTKHRLMSQDERLKDYLPETKYFSQESLWTMVEKHGQVMIKPCLGHKGYGVVQISALEDDQYELHKEFKKVILTGKEETYEYLKKNCIKRQRHFIVQQKIALAAINNDPFDIRVMIQRKRKSRDWVITGKLAKVAARNYVITNVAKAVLPVEEAISKSNIDNEQKQKTIAMLDEVSLLVVQHLASSYPRTRAFGLDVGIDSKGDIWIIEANISPSSSMFKFLKDGSYKTIIAYKRG
ncbi:YheC/YheD family protein [Neobacillus mesonae]|uniref:ATP-grasp domain-containing protein n=1 Tax=Neobacillus mesonae TaxID=1193713 RepID=A0A3Q9QWF6_9BACI|nr:YheC/YheD family protein [Neobacillus mesonae]AZU60405.1 hypothetical protein CHR53_03490 [Neobacillus mesonae]